MKDIVSIVYLWFMASTLDKGLLDITRSNEIARRQIYRRRDKKAGLAKRKRRAV